MAEGGIFCREVPLKPLPHRPPSIAPIVPDFVLSVVKEQLCAGALTSVDGLIPFDTDGGAGDGCASWGLATMQDSCCDVLPGEDDYNVTAEIFAIWLLLCALRVALLDDTLRESLRVMGSRLHICAVVDCKPAIAVATSHRTPRDRACLARDIHAALRDISTMDADVTFAWVPSHGKVAKNWDPDPRFTETELRALNDAADKAATRALDSARGSACRVDWVAAVDHAHRWTENVFKLISDAAARYKAYLERNWAFDGPEDAA